MNRKVRGENVRVFYGVYGRWPAQHGGQIERRDLIPNSAYTRRVHRVKPFFLQLQGLFKYNFWL